MLEVAITANSGDSSRPDLQLVDYDIRAPKPVIAPVNVEAKLMEAMEYYNESTLLCYWNLINAPGGQGWDCSDLEITMYQESSTSTSGHKERFYNVLTQVRRISFLFTSI